MAHVVVHVDLVDHLKWIQTPLGDLGIQEDARVGVAITVELRVQRAEPNLQLSIDDRVEIDDWHAVRIGAAERPVTDRLLNLLPGVHGDMRIQLPGDDDVPPIGRNVGTVGALGFGDEE